MQFTLPVRLTALVALLFVSATHGIVGQPGTLDPFFATGSPLGAGKVITPVGANGDSANAIALQPDGKILLAGQCAEASGFNHFCVLRYNADGTLDSGFGTAGKFITTNVNANSFGLTIALQLDGKIVLGGLCITSSPPPYACITRVNADGTPDLSFGGGAIVISQFFLSSDFYARSIAVQPDGKIILIGGCFGASTGDFCAIRYNHDGTIDAGFGTAGKAVTALGLANDTASAVALQPDGKFVVAGSCGTATFTGLCAARYNANGTLDTTFGNAGKVITVVGPSGVSAFNVVAFALQPDGKLLLAAICSGGTGTLCAARYRSDGTLDTGFGSAGTLIATLGVGGGILSALALQADGRIIFAGYCSNGTNNDFCAQRHNADGSLDASFGTAGKLLTPIGSGGDTVSAIAVQPDGKIVLAGSCAGTLNNDFCAARYDGGPFGYKTCSLDIDGDNRVLATTDSLIHTRIALGITGPAVINGISFPPTATRNTWPLIRDYLVTQCGMSLVQ